MSIINNTESRNSSAGQLGMASILVTMVLMVVMSLIVLGFAQVSRSNQRAAIDNQLTKQAYYAAETGVNDYAKKIRTYLTNNPNNPDLNALNKISCDTKNQPLAYKGIASSSLNGTTDVQYTCVLVTANPTSLSYSSVSSTKVIPINSSTTINSLTINWQTTQTNIANPTVNCPSALAIGQLPNKTNWTCGLGILKIDLVPVTGTIAFQNLMADNMTALLVPTNSGSTGTGMVSYTATTVNQYGSFVNQGAEVAAKCDTSNCSVTISGLNSTNYYLRVSTIYQFAAIQVAGYNSSSSSTQLPLVGAQVMVDSTGKAQDILRRVQIRIPVNSTAASSTFDAAIQTTLSLCKQFETSTTQPGDTGNYHKNNAPENDCPNNP